MVELNNIVARSAGHEEPAGPDEQTTDECNGRVALDVSLHKVVIVQHNELLGLLVIE